MSIIKNAWLVTNYTCNSRCDYCYATSAFSEKGTMPLKFGFGVLDELKNSGVNSCTIIGGEPTLYKHLTEMISYGISQGIKISIVSNGRKIANMAYLDSLIKAGINHVAISLEASCREKYAKICGVNAFEETVQGIRNCVTRGIRLNTITTICDSTHDEIENIARLSHFLGVKNIIFNFGVPSVNAPSDTDPYLPPEKLAKVAYQIFRNLRKDGIAAKFYGTIPLCAYSKKARLEMLDAKVIPNATSCHIFNGSGIVFEPDGAITPCTHFIKKSLFQSMDTNGNFAYKGTLVDTWNKKNGESEKFRNKLHRYPSDKCQGCKHWGRCIGGCPLLWRKFNPSEHVHPISAK